MSDLAPVKLLGRFPLALSLAENSRRGRSLCSPIPGTMICSQMIAPSPRLVISWSRNNTGDSFQTQLFNAFSPSRFNNENGEFSPARSIRGRQIDPRTVLFMKFLTFTAERIRTIKPHWEHNEVGRDNLFRLHAGKLLFSLCQSQCECYRFISNLRNGTRQIKDSRFSKYITEVKKKSYSP